MTARQVGAGDTNVLETHRLILRHPSIADFDDSYAMWRRPEVARYTIQRASTSEEAWTRILKYVGHWKLLGFGYWIVRDKITKRFIGEVGFADYRRDITPSLAGKPEIGWVLTPEAHGHGYATEAAQEALEWGGKVWPGRKTACIISPENQPSLRVAEKLGYQEVCRTRYHDSQTIIFER